MSTKRKKIAADFLKNIPSSTHSLVSAHFRALAFNDYIAARALLLSNLPLQGLVAASTAIEKYLKAILTTKGKVSPVHLDSKDFLDVVKAAGIDVSYLSESFIKYLGHAYQFRYIEADSGPASVVVETRKLLAELDYCVSMFEKYLILVVDGEVTRSAYAIAADEKDPRICTHNHVLEGITKSDFLSIPGLLYCVVIRPMRFLFPFEYNGFYSTNNSNFDFPKLEFDDEQNVRFFFGDIEETKRFYEQIQSIIERQDASKKFG